MIFSTPPITALLRRKLDELDSLWLELTRGGSGSSIWLGSLRRSVRASNVAASTSIEGFSVDRSEVGSIVGNTAVDDEALVNRMAVACYSRAMDHVGVLASDAHFRWLDRVVLDLHFDACYFQRDRSPGHWRTTPISVTGPDGGLDYTGPDPDKVPELMGEVIDSLERDDDSDHVAVRAAMAHLNVISVHPFRDGNGRISRIVQSLVLARGGLTSPEFNSIEGFLADHTKEYYAALRDTQGGRFQPERNASGWVAFCLDAHLAQARARLVQLDAAAKRWELLDTLVHQQGWPDRLAIALEQAIVGGVDRAKYASEADISLATASSDLRRLIDADLVTQRGRGRSTRYEASTRLREYLDTEQSDTT